MISKPLFVFILTILLSACTSTSKSTAQHGLPDTGRPALHAVSDARLHELMGRMNSLMFERFMAEPEIDQERRLYAQRMADTASKLGATVDDILSQLPKLNLDAEEQATFRALAAKLRDQAGTLKTQAELNRIDSIEETLEQTEATCSACHALFRKLDH